MQEIKTDDYFKEIVNVAVKENLLQMDPQCPLGYGEKYARDIKI